MVNKNLNEVSRFDKTIILQSILVICATVTIAVVIAGAVCQLNNKKDSALILTSLGVTMSTIFYLGLALTGLTQKMVKKEPKKFDILIEKLASLTEALSKQKPIAV